MLISASVASPELVLQLRGDILIKCYHCESPSERQVVFRVQFHTCAVSDAVLSFPRQDLDDACDGRWRRPVAEARTNSVVLCCVLLVAQYSISSFWQNWLFVLTFVSVLAFW